MPTNETYIKHQKSIVPEGYKFSYPEPLTRGQSDYTDM